MYDPFGYYRDKNIYAIKRNEHLPFYEDYPVTDSQWFIGENWVQVDKYPTNYLEDPDYLARLSEADTPELEQPPAKDEHEEAYQISAEQKQ